MRLTKKIWGIPAEAAVEHLANLRRRPLHGYALALIAVCAASVLRVALEPLLGPTLFFTTFYPAVAIVAIVGGTRPAILSIVLSALVTWYGFIPPRFEFTFGKVELTQVIVFMVFAGLLAAVVGTLNELTEWLLAQRDENKAEQERQAAEHRLMIGELDHRTHNLFGVVQMIALKSFPPGPDRDTYCGRLQALSNAYEAPAGGSGRLLLRNLLEMQLAPYTGQIKIDCCELALSGGAARDLALIVHELATNATKYGALSSADGRVLIVATLDGSGNSLSLTWKETGGPLVHAPAKVGFGDTILRRMPEFHGVRASIEYATTGLVYSCAAPMSYVAARSTRPG